MRKHFSNAMLLIVCFTVLAASVACADEPIMVGVMPFQSAVGDVSPTQATLIGDIFTQQLSRSDKMQIMGREQLNQIAIENKLVIGGYVSPQTAAKVGQLAECKYIVTGAVTEFNKKASSSGVLIVRSHKEEANAAADVNVIDVETGETILSISESGRAAQSGSGFDVGYFSSGQHDISGMEAGAVAELTAKLSSKVREAITGEYYQVTEKSGKEITLNIGTAAGAKKDALYRVYSVSGKREQNIAVVKIKTAHSDSSTAVIADKSGAGIHQRFAGGEVFRHGRCIGERFYTGLCKCKEDRA